MSRRRIAIAILIMAVALGAGAIYFLFDPNESGFFPRCVFLTLTGWKCPGCGTQRAAHALLHGDVMGAMRYNAFLLIALAMVALCAWGEWKRTTNTRLYLASSSKWVVGGFLAMVLAWWVLRNVMDW